MVEILPLIGSTFVTLLGAVLLLWIISILINDVSIIDLAFAILMFLPALVAYRLAETPDVHADLIFALVVIWAVRYSWYIFGRNLGKGEDVRYTALRKNVAEGQSFYWYSLKFVFLFQGAIIWLATMPAQLGIYIAGPGRIGVLGWLGAAIWLIGFFFETVADLQLRRFKSNPENKGKILQSGLWAYSRHPNYFGEVTLWWGIFLIALENTALLPTIIGPVIYTFVVVNITGKKNTDKKMRAEKPEYAAYIARTSGLIPWFPKKRL